MTNRNPTLTRMNTVSILCWRRSSTTIYRGSDHDRREALKRVYSHPHRAQHQGCVAAGQWK